MVSRPYGSDAGSSGESDAEDDMLTSGQVPEGSVSAPSSSPKRPGFGSGDTMTGHEIADNLPFGVILFDGDGGVVYANPHHRKLLGFDIRECGGIEEWLTRGCRDEAYAKKVIQSWWEHLWRKQLTRAFSLKTAEEKLREIEFRAKLLGDGGLLLTLFDVTESRRSEDALKLTEAKFNTVFHHAPVGIALVDRTGRLVETNPAVENLIDLPRSELRRQTLTDRVVAEDRAPLIAAEKSLLSSESANDVVLRARFRRGDTNEIAETEVTLAPIRDADRKVHYVAYLVREMQTGRSDSIDPIERSLEDDPWLPPVESGGERELRESQEQNRALLEAIPDLILLLKADGTIEDMMPPTGPWNGRLADEEWIGGSVSAFWPELGRRVKEAIRRALDDGKVSSWEFSSEIDAGALTYSIRIAPCGSEAAVAVISDVTERARAHEALVRRSLAFRHLTEAVILTNVRGRIVDWNPAAERIFGYSAKEIVGQGLATLYVPEDEADHFNQAMSDSLTRDGCWRDRRAFRRKNGEIASCEVVFLPVEEVGCPRSLLGIHRETTEESLDAVASERLRHRFRNQLQTVGSLFALEAGEAAVHGGDPRDLLRKFQARLRVVTRLPEFAVEPDGPVRMTALTRTLASDVERISQSGDAPPMRVTGDDEIVCPAEIAISIGLYAVEIALAAESHRRSHPDGEGLPMELTIVERDGYLRLTARAGSEVFQTASLAALKGLIQQMRASVRMVPEGESANLQVWIPTAN
ncbi:MAG: PAS domain S-box protein [Akkermansiaceae bacterium]|nr:PAS domain S-box protein [Akkermansiaceae bacterium]